jgi:putative acetyltransferase
VLDALRRPEVRFFVAREAEGKASATGAIVLHDGWAEIERMWVEEAARGRGIARQLLNVLIAEAAGAGVERAVSGQILGCPGCVSLGA